MPKEKMNNEAYERGKKDFIQDYFENVPFASIGGLEMRTAPQAPSYIKPEVAKEYIRGYEHQALKDIGVDWSQCEFSWKYAMTINKEEEKNE